MADLIKLRRDTAANWASANPVLAEAEVGIIMDVSPKQCKIGDGTNYWSDLPAQTWVEPDDISNLSSSIATVSSSLNSISGSTHTDIAAVSSSLGSISSSLNARDNSISSSLGSISSSVHTDISASNANVTELSSSFNTRANNISSSLGSISSSIHSDISASNASVIQVSSSLSASITAVSDDMKENYAQQNGYYEELTVGLAQDLEGNIGRVESSWKPIIRTTAGDLSVDSSKPVYLLSIAGVSDSSGNGLKLTGIRFNGFNALIPTQKLSGYTLSGNSVEASGTNVVAYFRCVEGIWGTYGVVDQNNGYLFTNSDNEQVTPVNVKTTSTIPEAGTTLSAVPTTSSNGHTYYLPQNSGDYLCVEFDSSVDLSNICAHIAWSNKNDDRFESRSEDTINLSSVMSAGSFTTYGLLSAGSGSNYVSDTLVFSDDRLYVTWSKKVAHVIPAELTWSVVGSETSESIVTTTFQATLGTAAAENPANDTDYTGLNGTLYWDNDNLKFNSTIISDTADLATEFGTSYLNYAVATPTSGTVAVVSSASCNDFGTEEVLGTDLVVDLGTIQTSYIGTIKDYIRTLPTQLSDNSEVIAKALTEQQAEINNIKETLSYLSAFLFTAQRSGSKIYLEGSGSPDWTPDMPFQFYRDRGVSPVPLWISVGNISASDWIKIAN